MRVQATDGVWLCDVGIGETAQREPIRLVEGLVQEQFGESYRLEKEDFLGWVLWDLYKGSWRKFYSFTEEPQLVADFVALNFYCEKHPESPFNKQEMFALKTLDGRRTLDGNLYKEIHNGTVTARELRPEEMPEAYASANALIHRHNLVRLYAKVRSCPMSRTIWSSFSNSALVSGWSR